METQAFLDDYKKQEQVQTTPSGIVYRLIEKGEGKVSPNANQTVTVHYEGKLINGEVFDSSYQRGTPAKFGLNQVIPGWTEGLQLMHEGDTMELVIPPELAYGPQGINGVIPGNSTLVFKVNLIEIQ
ncbi:MAG: FKBP-type peptidyl-prolyl cis-trans isomerase [Pseudomonadota bacterium]|nr:FKBP-type peptidyl-prolyl cis-trans isomerase [Pseudomonadota bacterium]